MTLLLVYLLQSRVDACSLLAAHVRVTRRVDT
jgi:hypothetical protein